MSLDTRSVSAYAKAELDPRILSYLLEPSLRGFLYWEPEQTTQAMLFIMLKQAIGYRRVPFPAAASPRCPRRWHGPHVHLSADVHGGSCPPGRRLHRPREG